MSIPRPRIRAALLSILMIKASLPLAAQLLTTSEWKLKVTVDAAAVRLKPELEGPIAAIVPKGTILQSYEATGAWYRVLTTSAKDGTSVIGYIATSDVEVLEEKTAPPEDFWPVQAQLYRGIGWPSGFTAAWASSPAPTSTPRWTAWPPWPRRRSWPRAIPR